MSWDVGFWAENGGGLVTLFGIRLVFGLKMGVVTACLDTRFLGLRLKISVKRLASRT